MTHNSRDSFTTAEEQALLAQLDESRLPRHIAVIMDGNGRWASRQGLPRVLGHRAGVESLRHTINACCALAIPYLTVFGFSSENWSRPAPEVTMLMLLIEEQMRQELRTLHASNVRVRHLGRATDLPDSLQRVLADATRETAGNTGLSLQFAINYSGRAELADAAARLAAAAAAGTLDPASIREADVAAALYAPDLPDPDLLIRTAGEMRVSNYLLWQAAYAEYWCTPDAWPDFRAAHLLRALVDYQGRQRKFGGIAS